MTIGIGENVETAPPLFLLRVHTHSDSIIPTIGAQLADILQHMLAEYRPSQVSRCILNNLSP